jgi:hypothetical protein
MNVRQGVATRDVFGVFHAPEQVLALHVPRPERRIRVVEEPGPPHQVLLPMDYPQPGSFGSFRRFGDFGTSLGFGVDGGEWEAPFLQLHRGLFDVLQQGRPQRERGGGRGGSGGAVLASMPNPSNGGADLDVTHLRGGPRVTRMRATFGETALMPPSEAFSSMGKRDASGGAAAATSRSSGSSRSSANLAARTVMQDVLRAFMDGFDSGLDDHLGKPNGDGSDGGDSDGDGGDDGGGGDRRDDDGSSGGGGGRAHGANLADDVMSALQLPLMAQLRGPSGGSGWSITESTMDVDGHHLPGVVRVHFFGPSNQTIRILQSPQSPESPHLSSLDRSGSLVDNARTGVHGDANVIAGGGAMVDAARGTAGAGGTAAAAIATDADAGAETAKSTAAGTQPIPFALHPQPRSVALVRGGGGGAAGAAGDRDIGSAAAARVGHRRGGEDEPTDSESESAPLQDPFVPSSSRRSSSNNSNSNNNADAVGERASANSAVASTPPTDGTVYVPSAVDRRRELRKGKGKGVDGGTDSATPVVVVANISLPFEIDASKPLDVWTHPDGTSVSPPRPSLRCPSLRVD